MRALVGLDVGTQAIRALVISEAGAVLGSASRPIETTYPAASRAEQQPEQWWSVALEVLREAIASPAVEGHEIVAISYAGTSCTAVALDDAGCPLRPALLWMDERAVEEARAITATGSPALRYSGGVVSPQWMLPKVRWLMRHEPHTFERARWLVEQIDFFTHRLSGAWTLGYGNAVAKWNYANPLGGWPEGFLADAGVEAARPKWPTSIVPLGSPIGPLLPDVAEAIGVNGTVLVVQGGVDAHLAMLGTGVIAPGDLAVVMGSSTVVIGQSREPIYADNWGPYPDAVQPGRYTLGGGQTTTGAIVQWLLRDIVGSAADGGAESLGRLDAAAAAIPPGSEGLVTLDHFGGNRTPWKDPDSRGVIAGLTIRHGVPHLLRSIHESVAFGTRAIVENLQAHGLEVHRMAASGGGSRSRLGVGILASVLGRPIEVAKQPETTAVGAAMVAGVGSGVFATFDDAIAALASDTTVIAPEKGAGAAYDFYFDRYLDVYRLLRQPIHEVVAYETRRASSAAAPA